MSNRTGETEFIETDLLRDRLLKASTAYQRVFYVTLLVGAVSLYFLYDAFGFEIPLGQQSTAQTEVMEHLETLEPLLRLSEQINDNPEPVNAYRAFLAPFSSLENEVSIAVSDASTSSLKWKALDKSELSLARDFHLSLATYEVELDLNSPGSDLRNLPVFNLATFDETYVHQSNLAGIQDVLEACRSVVSTLQPDSLALDIPEIPKDFTFRGFVGKRTEDSQLTRMLDEIPSRKTVLASVNALEQFAADNGLVNPVDTPEKIALHVTGRSLAVMRKTERVRVSFLPTEVEKAVLVVLLPLSCTAFLHMLLAHQRRKDSLRERLKERHPDEALADLDHPWLVSLIEGSGGVWWVNRAVLTSVFALGLMLPLVAQAAAAALLLQSAGQGGFIQFLAGVECLALAASIPAALLIGWTLIREWRGETRPLDPEPSADPARTVVAGLAGPVAEEDPYVGMPRSSVFHTRGCARLELSRATVTWKSRPSALLARRPCRICEP